MDNVSCVNQIDSLQAKSMKNWKLKTSIYYQKVYASDISFSILTNVCGYSSFLSNVFTNNEIAWIGNSEETILSWDLWHFLGKIIRAYDNSWWSNIWLISCSCFCEMRAIERCCDLSHFENIFCSFSMKIFERRLVTFEGMSRRFLTWHFFFA